MNWLEARDDGPGFGDHDPATQPARAMRAATFRGPGKADARPGVQRG
jgi:hypothetical protein